jgi:hypothetical protein
MDDNARLQLNQMIKANNVTDQTELIRELKHSHILRENINMLVLLRSKIKDETELYNISSQECTFLYTYYTDLYNKIRKDEIDLQILFEFLDVLKQIEDGLIDQHDGSFKIGTLLKKIYIDSALKKAEKLNNNEDKPIIHTPQIDISWKHFKLLNNRKKEE